MNEEIAVWGDELLEKGDPLGQIIALARMPGDRLRTAQREYERAHFSDRALETVWRYGVLDEVHLKTKLGVTSAREIATCPATRYLRVLELEVESSIPAEDPTPVLVEHGLPPSLRRLKLWARVGKPDLRSLYARIPHVEALDLWRPDVLGVIDLPRLRSLRVVSFDKAQLVDLARAKVPALESLAIVAVFWHELADLALPDLPSFHTLALTRPPWEPWFSQSEPYDESYCQRELRALVESPLAKLAKEIEFHGQLTTQMLGAIVVYASWLERFERVRFVRPKSSNIENELITRLGPRLGWIL